MRHGSEYDNKAEKLIVNDKRRVKAKEEQEGNMRIKMMALMVTMILLMSFISFSVFSQPVIEDIVYVADRMEGGYANLVNVSVSVNKTVSGSDLWLYAVKGPFESYDDAPDFEEGDFLRENLTQIRANGWYFFAVKDDEGEVTVAASEVTMIDRISPAIASIKCEPVSGKNGFGRCAVITVYAYDTQSRLASRAFSFDDGNTYAKECDLTVSENGTFHIRVRDALGNVSRKAFEVTVIDNEAPVIDITGNRDEVSEDDVILYVNCFDPSSGVGGLWYTKDEGMVPVYLGRYDSKKEVRGSLEIRENGVYTFFAEDMLGNISSEKVTISAIEKKKSSSSKKKTSSSKKSGSSSKRTTSSVRPVIITGSTVAGSSTSSKEDIELKKSSSASVSVFGNAEVHPEAAATVLVSENDIMEKEENGETEEWGGEEELKGFGDEEIVIDRYELYGLEKENIESELPVVLSEPETEMRSVSPNLVLPGISGDPEGPGRGAIAGMGVAIVLILLAVLVLRLHKLGLLDFPLRKAS